MRVLRLDLEYDGGGFAGWAVQPGLRTVEGTLAVRYLQPEAKSADRSRFDREYKKVARQLRWRLTWAERAQDLAFRLLYAVLRAQYLARRRLGLLHLRERWFGGRFARD